MVRIPPFANNLSANLSFAIYRKDKNKEKEAGKGQRFYAGFDMGCVVSIVCNYVMNYVADCAASYNKNCLIDNVLNYVIGSAVDSVIGSAVDRAIGCVDISVANCVIH